MNPILDAAVFAAEAHKGQTRKYTGTPYILHPMRVAARATLLPLADEHVVMAAWLHDVVEDCGVTLQQIEDRFGVLVPCYVEWLTNPSKGSKAPRVERKRMDREHIARAPLLVRAIKALDRIDNLREMTEQAGSFLSLYREESDALLDYLDVGGVHVPGFSDLREEYIWAMEAMPA